tara:strand:+ start:1274 stop:1498 length:225 start_codon:yes stop_codon:yes gene_type:complete
MKHTIELSDVQPYVKYKNTLASTYGRGNNKKLVAVMDELGIVYEVWWHDVRIKETTKLTVAVDAYNDKLAVSSG